MSNNRKRTRKKTQDIDSNNIDENTSFVGFVFSEEGSADGVFAHQNVSPGQIKLAGHTLVTIADRMFNEMWTAREREIKETELELIRKKIVTPGDFTL